jgi:GxxExxY protein
MHRRDAEAQRENEITKRVIGFAIEVHRALGPGLLESAYEECLCYELAQRGLPFLRQVQLPIRYKDVKLDCGYRMDLLIGDLVIVEIKAVESLAPIHEAQLLTCLKLAGKPVGLLINFNVPVLRQGIKRMVNHFLESSASPRLCGKDLV